MTGLTFETALGVLHFSIGRSHEHDEVLFSVDCKPNILQGLTKTQAKALAKELTQYASELPNEEPK